MKLFSIHKAQVSLSFGIMFYYCICILLLGLGELLDGHSLSGEFLLLKMGIGLKIFDTRLMISIILVIA